MCVDIFQSAILCEARVSSFLDQNCSTDLVSFSDYNITTATQIDNNKVSLNPYSTELVLKSTSHLQHWCLCCRYLGHCSLTLN